MMKYSLTQTPETSRYKHEKNCTLVHSFVHSFIQCLASNRVCASVGIPDEHTSQFPRTHILVGQPRNEHTQLQESVLNPHRSC